MSDSDPESFDRADLTVEAEDAQSKLQDENAQLRKVNARLKAQFEDAVRISSQLEDIHQKNRSLSAEVRELKTENEELQKRLEISLRSSSEANALLADEKKSSAAQLESGHTASQKELQKAKESAKAQIDEVYAQLQQAQQANQGLEVDKKNTKSKISRLLHNASQFFDSSFDALDGFIEFLGRPKTTAAAPSPASATATGKADPAREKEVKALKAQLRASVQAKEDVEGQLARSQRENQQIEARLKEKLSDQEAKQRVEAGDWARENSAKDHQIGLLEAKVQSLTSQLQKAKKASPAVPAPKPSPEPPAPAPEKPKSSKSPAKGKAKGCRQPSELVLEDLINGNAELTKQLQNFAARAEDLQDRLEKAEKKNTALEIQCEKEKTNLKAATLVHNETVEELKTARAVLHQQESHKEKNAKEKLQREVRDKQAEITRLGKTIEDLEKQVKELTVANLEESRTSEQQAAKISKLKETVLDQEKQIDSLNGDLSQAEQNLQEKPTVTPEDLLPPQVWRFAEFDPALNAEIGKLGSGQLQPVSKLQGVFHAINKFFVSEIQSRDTALDQAYSDNQAINQALNEFLVNLSIALAIDPVTSNDFLGGQAGSSVVATAGDLKSAYDDLKRRSEELEAVVEHFHSSFGLKADGSAATAIENVNATKRKVTDQAESIRQKTAKIKELTTNLRNLTKKAESDTADFESQIAELSRQLEDTRQALDEETNTNQSLKQERSDLRAEFRAYQQRQEEATAALNEEHEQQLKAAALSQAQLEADLQEKLRQQKQDYDEAAENLAEAQESINVLRKTLKAQKETIQEKEAQLRQNQRDAANREETLISRSEAEKQQLIDSYEKAVEELRAQCEAHRSDLSKVGEDLAGSEKQLKKAHATILDLKRTKQRLENELKEGEEQAARDKQLNQAAAQLAVQTAESDCASKANEQKAECEKDKRRLFAFIADAFKQLGSSQDKLDERSIKQLITKARDELATLSSVDASVRRIVGAGAHQRTDDAVAQVCLGKD
jgi:chromosome segregation ATPase